MLRENNNHSLHWADKTMSVMRERQLEACEDRLAAYPPFDVFEGCDNTQVEELWRTSYDAQEHPMLMALHSVEKLQAQVMTLLAHEAALLSVAEHQLVERLLVLQGEAELMELEESDPAESLVRRMWCHLEWREDDRLFICLPKALLVPLTEVFADEKHQQARERLIRFDATVRGLMYIGGFLHYEEPLSHLLRDVVQHLSEDSEQLAMRFFRASYDYIYDARGDMILLHPGLAEPERLLQHGLPRTAPETVHMDQSTLMGAIGGLLPEEIPSYMQMLGLLHGAVRPEISEEEAVEDLRMLAKQGVSLEEMNEVLGTLLIMKPTPAMMEGVRTICMQTPRWCGIPAAVVQ